MNRAETPEKVFRSVIPSQLVSAIDETPGLIVPVIVSFAVLEVLPLSDDITSIIPTTSLYTLKAVLAVLVGLVQYAGGNYWDDKFFDPRYGPGGTWAKTDKRPLRVFPPGKEMDDARRLAAKRLLGVDASKQAGVYTAAEDLLRERGRWSDVEGALVLSKVARSYIWPAIITTLIGAAIILSGLLLREKNLVFHILLTVVVGGVAAGSFIPYCHFRVKHMIRLYKLASRLSESKDAL